jgi:hypothetical protein
MSMNFSEFKRQLGIEPRGSDPAFLRARQSGPEFEEAACAAERFEDSLERAVQIPAPDNFLGEILAINQNPPATEKSRHWLPIAMAASVLVAVGVTGLVWNMNHSWDSVEDYVADHYRHDGISLLNSGNIGDVQELFAGLDVQAAPALASIVGVIKYCPTPDGKGVHMILNTESGPITVIYMPDTPVIDGEQFAFDGVEAILVDLKRGSAAIIGPNTQAISNMYAFIQDSIVPLSPSS